MQVRPLTTDDAKDIHATFRAWETHWEIPRVTSLNRAMEWLTAPSVSMPEDTRSYWDGEDLIAYGLVSHMPSDRGFEVAPTFGLVRPDHQGKGLGTDLLGWQVDRAKDRLSSRDPTHPWLVRAITWDWMDDTRRLYSRHGFEMVRSFAEMLKDLAGSPSPLPPEGVRLVPWDRDQDEAARLVNNRAFADHWGAVPMSPGNWDVIVSADETRLDLSFMALAGGRLIGSALNAYYPGDQQVTGRQEGWVRVLSVEKDWRGRGVGSALLNASFGAFDGAGYTHSMIRVDAESLTGAHRLYESHGYRTIRTFSFYDLEVNSAKF